MEDNPQASSPPHEMPEEELTPEEWLAKSLKLAREWLGLSQEHVAQLMGLYGFKWRQTTVQKTEAASRPIRVNEAVALAEVLRIHPADLLGDVRDEWATHAQLLRLTARDNRLGDRIQALRDEIVELSRERDDLTDEFQEARRAHGLAVRKRDLAPRITKTPETLKLTTYGDVHHVVSRVRHGDPVVADFEAMSPDDADHTYDFITGLAAGSGSSVARIGKRCVLMCPPNVPAEDVLDNLPREH